MAKHGRSSQVSCWHSSHPCNPQLLWPCFTGCSATTAAVCGEQGPYSLCATLGMHQQSWRGALMPWSTDSTDSWLAESVWQDRRALLLIAALGWIQVKAVLDAPSNKCQCKGWYLKEGWRIIMYFAAVGHLICTKLVNWNLLRCTFFFFWGENGEALLRRHAAEASAQISQDVYANESSSTQARSNLQFGKGAESQRVSLEWKVRGRQSICLVCASVW